MKQATFSLLAIAALAGVSYAGQEIAYSGKTVKEYKQVEETCFLDQELQLDIYGAYIDGNGHTHAGPIKDHGWGGGVGINYFFTRNIGIGADATWFYAKDNPGGNHHAHDRHNQDETIIHQFTGSLIFRLPIDELCLAPYAFVGGGFTTDSDQWASAHGGVGLEYRVVPNKIGLFTDARWTYYGDRFGSGDQNNFMAKAGVRIVF